MGNDILVKEFLTTMTAGLNILPDKSEENAFNTLCALWHTATGNRVSPIIAANLDLPQLSPSQLIVLKELVKIRLSGVPLAHLTGRQNFMGIELICDSRALIPRKETEILGETALEICNKLVENNSNINVLDVCCGSGNLGLVLASYQPKVIVNSSDLSAEAVDLTKENISFLNLIKRVKVVQSDLFENFETEGYWGKTDLIVCNPPYISTSKVTKMNTEIANNEPAMAFDGGMIGLKVIQKLIIEAPKFLTKNGWLVFEVGLGQGPFIIQLCEKSGFWPLIRSASDTSGNIRVIAVCRKSENIESKTQTI